MLKKIKNLNNWLIILCFPIGFLFLIIITILRPFILIRFGQITAYRFGHYIKNVELYLSHKKIEPQNFLKTIDIFFLSSVKANLYYEKIISRQIIICPYQLFWLAYKLAKKIFFLRKNLIDLRTYDFDDKNNLLDKIDCQIKFTPNETQEADKLLEEIGVSSNDKFVCLFARDERYAKNYLLSNYNSYNKWKFRNSNIETFKLASEALVKLGYKVIRVGKDTEKKISFANDNIIDYSWSKVRCDFLDLYLAFRCEFAFGDSGAWSNAPIVFRKYIGFANWIPLDGINLFSKRFTFIFKYYYDELLNRNLSINEVFFRKLHGYDETKLKKENILVVDNSPEDILKLVVEVEKKFSGKFIFKEDYIFLNKKFKKFLNKNDFFVKKFDYPQKRFILEGSCEEEYLKKNFD